MPDNKRLSRFIARLGTDPALLKKFHADPQAVSLEHNLSAAETGVLATRDPALIQQTIVGDVINPLVRGTIVGAEAFEVVLVIVL